MRNTIIILVVLGSLMVVLPNVSAEIPPRMGLYDPVTMRSTTTGDLYPVFPDGVNEIPPLNVDRVDQIDQALCILIHTPDIANTHFPTSFDSSLFSTGLYPTGSMNDFFLESSYGLFGVEGDVVGWITAENPYSYYTDGDYGTGDYPNNSQRLVEEAVWGAEALGVDFSNYDNDGDGAVDALIIVHQGPGAENTGSVDDIWSHRWGIPPIYLDGVEISDYSMNPELSGTGTTGALENIGVYAHEYTHLLGLSDLYDYDSKLDDSTFTTLGDANDHPLMDWCVMGYGGYGISSYGRGESPNHHTAYLKTLLGWVDPIILGTSQTNISISEFEVNPQVYQIPIGGSDTEYFLIENRNPLCSSALFDKWDSDFSAWFEAFTAGSNPLDAGLIITHIDETMPLNNGYPDNDHYGCRVVDAGYVYNQPFNGNEFTEWWYPFEFRVGAAWSSEDNQTEFTPESVPNSDGYNGPSGISITNISNSGSIMSFDLGFSGGVAELHYSRTKVINDTRDHDGFIDQDESGDVFIGIRNTGIGEAITVSGVLTTSDPYVTINSGSSDYPNIGVLQSEDNLMPFNLSVASNCPAAYDAPVQLEISWDGGNSTSIDLLLEVNWDLAFSDDIESGVGSWTHSVAGGNFNDQWHISTLRNHTEGGQSSWKCGNDGSGSYSTFLNAELSIIFDTFQETRVSFWHRMNCEEEWDGGILERENNGGWEQIFPIDGYPDEITHSGSGGPFDSGTECFSSDFDWIQDRAVVPDGSDNEKIRFRFGSDRGSGEEGWYVDDIRIYHGEGLVGVEEKETTMIPDQLSLQSAFPNPFNSSTKLTYMLPKQTSVRLEIFDINARKVKVLVDDVQGVGKHSMHFSSDGLVSGMYFLVLTTPAKTLTQKIVHIK